jgi:hypothetical protein
MAGTDRWSSFVLARSTCFHLVLSSYRGSLNASSSYNSLPGVHDSLFVFFAVLPEDLLRLFQPADFPYPGAALVKRLIEIC